MVRNDANLQHSLFVSCWVIYIYIYLYTVQGHQDLDLEMLRSVISNMPSTTAVVAEILTSM